MRLAVLDVHYAAAGGAHAACVVASAWDAAAPIAEHVADIADVKPYVPGRFAERELPCLLAVLAKVGSIDVAVVDGHVWLDASSSRPGLGAQLHAALGGATPVVGVAKTPFRGAAAVAVTRGKSRTPLYVSAAGMSAADAAAHVRAMHGAFRIPTLLALADRFARG